MNILKLASCALMVGGGIVGSTLGIQKLLQQEETTDFSDEQITALINQTSFTEEDYLTMRQNWLSIIPKATIEFLKKFDHQLHNNFYSIEFGSWLLDKDNPSSKTSIYLPMFKKIRSVPPAQRQELTWKRIQINTGKTNNVEKIKITYDGIDNTKELDATTKITQEFINTCTNWMEEKGCATENIGQENKTLIYEVYSIYKAVEDRLKVLGIENPDPKTGTGSWTVKLDTD